MKDLTPSFKFKYDKDMAGMTLIHPILLMVFADFNLWAYERDLPVKVTRIIDERIEGISVSDTHSEGRAIDVSVVGWSTDEIDDAIFYFNKLYADLYGAYSYSDGHPRIVVPPNHGTAPHLHFQIRRFK